MLSRTGTHTRPGYNRLTYLPSSFIYLFFLLPSSSHPWLWIDHGHARWQLSPSISIANEAGEKEVTLECVKTEAAVWLQSELRPKPVPGDAHQVRLVCIR